MWNEALLEEKNPDETKRGSAGWRFDDLITRHTSTLYLPLHLPDDPRFSTRQTRQTLCLSVVWDD